MISYRIHQEHIIRAIWNYLDEHPRGIGKKLLKRTEKFAGKQSERAKDEKVVLAKSVKNSFKVRLAPGRVYSFRYNARWADQLPYYDRYPFVLVLKRDNKTHRFTGLNLHYIDPHYRTELLKAIDHLYTSGMDRYYVRDFFGDVTVWARRIAKPCLHTYRFDRVMNLRYWQIPTQAAAWTAGVKDQTFIRSGLMRVWIDSRKQMFRGARWKQRQKEKRAAERKTKTYVSGRMKKKAAAMKARQNFALRGKIKPRTVSPVSRASKAGKKSKTSRRSRAATGKRNGK